MKAEEPRVAKYGMPASESQPFEAAQLAIMQERVLFKALHFQHALRVGPALRATLDALEGKGDASTSVEEPESPVVTPAPAPTELRAALGLR
jgi:hypothetical protein